ALADLAHAGRDGIAEALGVPGDQAEKLLHRARENFAARLGMPRSQADEAARNWMWAAPPQRVWEELYPRFHQTVERELRRGPMDLTLVLTPGEAGSSTSSAPTRQRQLPRVRIPRRRWSSRRRPNWTVIAIVAVVLGLGGAAAARLAGVGTSSDQRGSQPAVPAGPALQSSDATAGA